MAELIHPELSYKITGLCYKTQNQLGTKFQEKHYLKALCALLDIKKIPYQTEVKLTLIRYLDSIDLPLALLINFRKRPLQIWRITKSRKH